MLVGAAISSAAAAASINVGIVLDGSAFETELSVLNAETLSLQIVTSDAASYDITWPDNTTVAATSGVATTWSGTASNTPVKVSFGPGQHPIGRFRLTAGDFAITTDELNSLNRYENITEFHFANNPLQVDWVAVANPGLLDLYLTGTFPSSSITIEDLTSAAPNLESIYINTHQVSISGSGVSAIANAPNLAWWLFNSNQSNLVLDLEAMSVSLPNGFEYIYAGSGTTTSGDWKVIYDNSPSLLHVVVSGGTDNTTWSAVVDTFAANYQRFYCISSSFSGTEIDTALESFANVTSWGGNKEINLQGSGNATPGHASLKSGGWIDQILAATGSPTVSVNSAFETEMSVSGATSLTLNIVTNNSATYDVTWPDDVTESLASGVTHSWTGVSSNTPVKLAFGPNQYPTSFEPLSGGWSTTTAEYQSLNRYEEITRIRVNSSGVAFNLDEIITDAITYLYFTSSSASVTGAVDVFMPKMPNATYMILHGDGLLITGDLNAGSLSTPLVSTFSLNASGANITATLDNISANWSSVTSWGITLASGQIIGSLDTFIDNIPAVVSLIIDAPGTYTGDAKYVIDNATSLNTLRLESPVANIDCSAVPVFPSAFKYLTLECDGLTTTEVDRVLEGLAVNVTTWTGNKLVNLQGNNAAAGTPSTEVNGWIDDIHAVDAAVVIAVNS